jgi:DNA-binding FrmR family transcriptional regulator
MNEDREKAVQALKTAKGQIEGIMNMIENGRYCIDISNQIIAAQALLKKSNILILKQHLNNCVRGALINGDGESEINELVTILERITYK